MKKAMLRGVALVYIFALLTMLFTGCLARTSPDEFGYAMIIGIDEGMEKPYYVSMLLQRGSGSEGAGQSEVNAFVGVECENLFDAIGMMESSLPFALNLSRAGAIVFGEDVAIGEGVEELLSASLGTLSIRYYANLIVARGRADAYLKGIRTELTTNIAKLQYGFLKYSKETGYVPAITLAQFYDRAWSGVGDVLLPLAAYEENEKEEEQPEQKEEKEKNPFTPGSALTGGIKTQTDRDTVADEQRDVEFSTDMLGEKVFLPGNDLREGGLNAGMMGSAVFHNTQMVGVLNALHTQLVMMGTGQFHHGRIFVPLQDGETVSVFLQNAGRPKVELELGEIPQGHIFVTLRADVEKPNILQNAQDEMELKRYIEQYIEKGMTEVFIASQKSESDVFAFGKAAVAQFTDTDLWEAYGWEEAYAGMGATFSVELRLAYNPTNSRME